MTLEQFLAVESWLEPAAAKLLTARRLAVSSPFLRAIGFDAKGDPVLEELPDECCIVTASLQRIDSSLRVFAKNAAGDERSIGCGAVIMLEVWHRVPAGDVLNAKPGEPPSCYVRLCAQRGRIRATFLDDNDPFTDALPEIDILSIDIPEPDKSVDRERHANQATERFLITALPRAGALTPATTVNA